MIGDIADSVSAVAVVVSLLLLARQTAKLREQTEITNLMGRYEALNSASERYDQALMLLVQYPELRPYVLDGHPLDDDDPNRDRALLVADLMAGAIDHANRVSQRFPDPRHDQGWQRMAVAASRRPVFQAVLSRNPHEFPDLMAALADAGRPLDDGPGQESLRAGPRP
ncbi:hypothetical protein [Actinoplanes couchii]|uniref:Secreted protein n=1 Tax=Actinoplanes couchii TaxID=403638 RepID=A0ABQ3XLX7_9ACTN|nr:hypothetical protein [Actinoplanes couchii]MDR6319277.1 hypothetical protein [Actinoplanes couchii]GID59514.1 hypothetical protein Aco03nite_079180 [Actinoplanes couchii]